MKFKFECPYCGQRISATEADVNTVGVCPACQRDVNVPPPPVEPPAEPPAPVERPEPVAAAAAPPPVKPPAVLASTVVLPATPSPAPAAPPPAASPAPAPAPAPKRVPLRPERRAVAPQPVSRRPPSEPDYLEPMREKPGLPFFTLFVCALPIMGLLLLRVAGLLSSFRFELLLGLAGFLCVISLIMAHRAWFRSRGRFLARAVSVLSLLVAYGSAVGIGSMATAISTGAIVLVKPVEAVPDFKGDGPLVAPTATPAATPAVAIAATPAPAAAPAAPAATPVAVAMNTAAAAPAVAAAGGSSADPLQFFEGKIKPILTDKCYKCHSIESGKSKAGLTLDTREGLLKGGETGPGVEPGSPEKSLLIKAILYEDDNLQMPPKGEKLSAQDIADLTTWVKMGAPYAGKAK